MLKDQLRVFFFVMFFSLPVISKELSLAAIHYPPYTVVSKHGEINGTDAQLVRAVFAMQNTHAYILNPPWSRALKSVEHGKIDGLVSCTKNNYRAKYMLFSQPINEINNGLIVKNDSNIPPPKSIEDLRGLKLIAIHKWNTQTELNNHGIAHAQANSIPQALDMLLMRNFDAIYSGTESITYFAKQAQLGNKLKVVLFEERPPITLHMCLGKKMRNAESIMTRFNQDLAQYNKNKK
ncbi:ABC-type transporter periplasmic subunit family 3 [Vibrio nigripulchritudo ATCC 27043]|uniref:substrate-binding periplasmic protein n=1 Tax=Vibrio nigripulchritudo TaxID=28173 RepID=UPI00021C31CB|nr:transporter substrate-binding domain-containing protein [Vibrio nigripulchritudo]EGU55225.1 ABC-type transporter periplasmic subunit family 3 [Vibrio nigripulchritudo ATCC 27043]